MDKKAGETPGGMEEMKKIKSFFQKRLTIAPPHAIISKCAVNSANFAVHVRAHCDKDKDQEEFP